MYVKLSAEVQLDSARYTKETELHYSKYGKCPRHRFSSQEKRSKPALYLSSAQVGATWKSRIELRAFEK